MMKILIKKFLELIPPFWCSILINNKLEKGYTIVLKSIKRILTAEDKLNINLYSITLDFEEGIINAINLLFQK